MTKQLDQFGPYRFMAGERADSRWGAHLWGLDWQSALAPIPTHWAPITPPEE